MRLFTAYIAALLGLLFGAAGAQAAATPWLDHDHAQVRLVAESDTAGQADKINLGLQFKLAPGWKIYWRSPGDAGFPPSLDWQGSDNLGDAEIRWPAPHRFALFGLQTFGYGGEVVLPIAARLERPGEAVALRAALSYLVCSEICVPHDAELSLDLAAGPGTPALHAGLIDQALELVPDDGSRAGLSLQRAVLTGSVERPVLKVVARAQDPFEAPDLLVEGPPGFVFDPPEVRLRDGDRRVELAVAVGRSPVAEGVLEGKRLTLTMIDGRRALETEVIARHDGMPSALARPDGATLLVMLGLAVLGGLILNLMPCVLPVLSIKLLSVVSHGGRDRRAVRIGFLASAAGILFSFLVLAGAALGLKAAGLAAGWGIQFQQPLFLSTMAAVIALFAFNLLGLFEIPLPAWLGGLGQGVTAGGPPHEGSHSLAGHFLTGAFATLLATPCSAPFLGTAVGFALARGAPEILMIFVALGLGLALPYLLVALFPVLATRLPRPGPWIVVLRRILGLALIGTAAWLLTVLATQVSAAAALVVAAAIAATGVVLLAGRRLPRPASNATVAALVLAAVLAPSGFAAPQRLAVAAATAQDWRPLDEAAIAGLVADGKVVFVDVTADWCITCQVNKSLVIERGAVADRLAGDSVVTMRGDWTLPSDAIADYLAGFGRYGIPFNAVYGPGAPQGRALPELLTVDAVLEAIDGAGAGASPVVATGD